MIINPANLATTVVAFLLTSIISNYLFPSLGLPKILVITVFILLLFFIAFHIRHSFTFKRDILKILKEINSFKSGLEILEKFPKFMDKYTPPTFSIEYFPCKPKATEISYKDLLKYITDEDNDREVLMIWAQAGMGKSRLLCNLTYKLVLSSKSKYKYESPNPTNSIYCLINGIYYTEFKNYKSTVEIVNEIKKIEENTKINYIILDGFDECPELFANDSPVEVLNSFFNAIKENNIINRISKIIISSRVDMFDNEKKEFLELKIPRAMTKKTDNKIDIIKINEFSEINQIINIYNISNVSKLKKKPIINRIKKHLKDDKRKESLLRVPFFIKYADELFNNNEDNEFITWEKGLDIIVNGCIDKEYGKYDVKLNLNEREEYKAEILSVLGKIAYSMYKKKSIFLNKDEYNSIPCKEGYESQKRRFSIRKEETFEFQHKLFYEYFLAYHVFNCNFNDKTMQLKECKEILGLYADDEKYRYEYLKHLNSKFSKNLYSIFLEEKWEKIKENVESILYENKEYSISDTSPIMLLNAKIITITDNPSLTIDKIIIILPFMQSLLYKKFKINNSLDLKDLALEEYVDEGFLEINKDALIDSSGAEKFGELKVLDTTAGKIELSQLEHYAEIKELQISIGEPKDLDNLINLMNEKSINKCKLFIKSFKYKLLPELVQRVIDENLKQERFSFYNSISTDLVFKGLNTVKIENSELSITFDKETSEKDFLFIEGLYFIEIYYSNFKNENMQSKLLLLRKIIYNNPEFFYDFTLNLYKQRSIDYGKNHPFTKSALYFFIQSHICSKGIDNFNKELNVELQYFNEDLYEHFLLKEKIDDLLNYNNREDFFKFITNPDVLHIAGLVYPVVVLGKSCYLIYMELLKCYDKVIELNPKNESAWNLKGYCLRNMERYDEAIVCYDKAIELNPKYESSWYWKGYCLRNMERYEEAITCCDKAIELNPKDEFNWRLKGNCLQDMKRYDEAIVCYDKAIELNPKYESSWHWKGVCLQNMEHFDEALACYDKAIELNPKYESSWHWKGACLRDMKRYDEAIVCYDKAIELNPDYLNAKFHLLFLYRDKLNEPEKATELFNEIEKEVYKDENKEFLSRYYAHKMLFELHNRNLSLAKENLLKSFKIIEKESELTSIANDVWWAKFGSVIIDLNCGSWLLEIFEEKGYDVVLSPYYTAVKALVIEKQDIKNGKKNAETYLNNRAIEISEPAIDIIKKIRKYSIKM